MSYYINEDSKGNLLPDTGKAEALIADGAKAVSGLIFQPNMICVVKNPFSFDAAVYAHKSMYNHIIKYPDYREKVWLIHPMARELSGFTGDE